MGPGSLRRAIISADVAGGGTIHFAIGSGPKTIHSTSLPVTAVPMTIDGTTQPGYSGQPLITIDGGDSASGFKINWAGHGTLIRGLAISGFGVGVRINGSPRNTITDDTVSGNDGNGIVITGDPATGNVVQRCKIGTNSAGNAANNNAGYGVIVSGGASNNTIGSATAGNGNVISGNSYGGVKLTDPGTTNNVVAGNRIGTDASGTVHVSNGDSGISILNGASSNLIGGLNAGSANVVSGNNANGIDINGSGTSGNVVEGNFIGTDRLGRNAVPNEEGINITGGASNNMIGGTSPAARNILSGNFDNGVDIHDEGTTGNRVRGNFIGTDASGNIGVPNRGDGVLVVNGASKNTIGGIIAGAGNTIAFNLGNGVAIGQRVDESTDGVAVYDNSIFSNVQLGIDLGDDGVTANTDSQGWGPNLRQNTPVLSNVTTDGQSTTVQGTLSGTANSVFRLEFYATRPDPTGFGQGQRFLGAVNVTTDSSGTAHFSVVLQAGVSAGQVVAAVAIDHLGNASEFSHDLAPS